MIKEILRVCSENNERRGRDEETARKIAMMGQRFTPADIVMRRFGLSLEQFNEWYRDDYENGFNGTVDDIVGNVIGMALDSDITASVRLQASQYLLANRDRVNWGKDGGNTNGAVTVLMIDTGVPQPTMKEAKVDEQHTATEC